MIVPVLSTFWWETLLPWMVFVRLVLVIGMPALLMLLSPRWLYKRVLFVAVVAIALF